MPCARTTAKKLKCAADLRCHCPCSPKARLRPWQRTHNKTTGGAELNHSLSREALRCLLARHQCQAARCGCKNDFPSSGGRRLAPWASDAATPCRRLSSRGRCILSLSGAKTSIALPNVELTGPTRQGAPPAQSMMNPCCVWAARPAVAGPVERRVRHVLKVKGCQRHKAATSFAGRKR